MSTQFFRVTDGDELVWVAGLVPERGLWVWVPNTGAWHHHRDLEVDFATTRELSYEAIADDEAARLIVQAPRVDERAGMGGWIVEQFRQQEPSEQLSSAQIGIPSGWEARPTSSDLARRLIESKDWIVVKAYDEDTPKADAAARKLVSRLLNGSMAKLQSLGDLDARKVTHEGHLLVLARLQDGAEHPTGPLLLPSLTQDLTGRSGRR